MKLSYKITTVALAACLSVVALAGCSSGTTNVIKSSNDTSSNSAYNYSYMPAGHEDRVANFSDLGAAGCYGCHGSSATSDPFLTGVKAIPDSHYQNGDRTTHKLDSSRLTCINCHTVKE